MWMSCFSSSSSIADASCSSVSEFGFQAQLLYTLQVLDIFSDWPGALSGFMCCHGYFWELCQVMKSLNTHETTCSSPPLSCHLCLLVFNTSEDRCSLLWNSCSSSNPDVFWYQSLTPADLLVQTVGILKSRVWYTNLLFLLLRLLLCKSASVVVLVALAQTAHQSWSKCSVGLRSGLQAGITIQTPPLSGRAL